MKPDVEAARAAGKNFEDVFDCKPLGETQDAAQADEWEQVSILNYKATKKPNYNSIPEGAPSRSAKYHYLKRDEKKAPAAARQPQQR